jgi:hypothetical protein
MPFVLVIFIIIAFGFTTNILITCVKITFVKTPFAQATFL